MELRMPFDGPNDILAPHSFKNQVGKKILLKNMITGKTSDATIVASSVSEDGKALNLTIETEDSNG